jgi:hypothetical protein
LYEGRFGQENRSQCASISKGVAYEWACITKLMAWIGGLQLEGQGKAGLERGVRRCRPDGFFEEAAL